MFDARNKGQPKLVSANFFLGDLNVKEDNKTPFRISQDPGGTTQKDSRSSSERSEPQPQHHNRDLMQQQTQQQQQQQTPYQKQQQKQQQQIQQAQIQLQSSKKPSTHQVGEANFRKDLFVTDTKLQKENMQKSSSLPPSFTTRETHSASTRIHQNGTTTNLDKFEDLQLHRSTDKNHTNATVIEIRQSKSSASSSTEGNKMLAVANSAHKQQVVTNSDPPYVTVLRHSKKGDKMVAGVKHPHSPTYFVPSPQAMHPHQQQMLYHQRHNSLQRQNHHPQQYLHHQQFQQHQQAHQPSQQQVILRHSSQPHDEVTVHGQVVRIRSHPAGTVAVPVTMSASANSYRSSGKGWSIPRVSSSSVSTRPHSLTLPPTWHYESGNPGNQHSSGKEFSSYNPSASPRALRAHTKHEFDNIPRQDTSSNSGSISSSSSNPPKSILKNNLTLEQSDLYFSSRPLVLPRAHSENTPNPPTRDFDFSSILTANKDPLSSKGPSIQVQGQVYGQSSVSSSSSSGQPPQRPVSANSVLVKIDQNEEERPIRKSVTFNALVQLHHEDQMPTVQSLPVDS